MTGIKVCGLKRPEDVSYVNEVRPEYAGLVFWERSKRNVSFELAKKLRNLLSEEIKTVGVFVDADMECITSLVKENIISCVQLHGTETDDTIKELRERLPKGIVIIKAFEVKCSEDIDRANASCADMVLIDSGKGSGNTFDWQLLSQMKREYFLAGGLSPQNVSEAVMKLHPYAVDVSSGVETDGFKDRDKINDFVAAVKAADRRQ